MKYKVGDKVLIRSDLKYGNDYGETYFNREMEKYCGKTLTVESVSNVGYTFLDLSYWNWTDEMIERKIMFTKADLKTGDMVTYRNGDTRFVLLNTKDGDILIDKHNRRCSFLDCDDNLIFGNSFSRMDIMAVRRLDTTHNFFCDSGYEIIWKRPEKLKLTLAEIAEKFGKSVDEIEVVGCEFDE